MAELTYREAVAAGIAQEMARDERVVFLGEDVAAAGGVFKATVGLYEQFGPLRVRDTPISEAVIAGTEGRIVMRNRFHNAMATIELVMDRGEPLVIEVDREEGYGYQFEARHVNECLRKGLTESPVMTHADTLMLMETLDRIRKSCDVRYPVDV